MGGCTNCGGKVGCDTRKGAMFGAVDDALAALYPTRTWGEPDDLARFEAGIFPGECEHLADELATHLRASTFYRPGDDGEYCDYIYVMCVGREPSLVQIRDGAVPVPDEVVAAGVEELHLRVCLSTMARLAAVQQVSMTMAAGEGVIVETPRAGVYDPPLLRRFQKLVAVLPAYDIVHVDFGEISAPPAGFDPGDYAGRFGGEPHVANYLFYPQPSTTCVTTIV